MNRRVRPLLAIPTAVLMGAGLQNFGQPNQVYFGDAAGSMAAKVTPCHPVSCHPARPQPPWHHDVRSRRWVAVALTSFGRGR